MTAYKPYVPQYKEAGIEPLRFPTHTIPASKPKVVQRKPFLSRPVEEPAQHQPFMAAFTSRKREAQSELPAVIPMANVPYAERAAPVARTTTLPNVGNNMETTWTSLNDYSLVENTAPVDPDHPMIDNNEFTDAAFGLPQTDLYGQGIPLRPPLMIEETAMPTPQANDYYLLVRGEMISNGSKEHIQSEVEALMYEVHPLSEGNSIAPDDILVLKKVLVNVGVFLSE